MGTTMDKPLVQEAETAFQAVDLGSTVQVGEPPRYGVVKWLGMFPGGSEPMAGIELVRSTINRSSLCVCVCVCCGYRPIQANSCATRINITM